MLILSRGLTVDSTLLNVVADVSYCTGLFVCCEYAVVLQELSGHSEHGRGGLDDLHPFLLHYYIVNDLRWDYLVNVLHPVG